MESCPGFVPPGQWAALDDEARASAWTLDSQTVLLLGACPEEAAGQLPARRRYGGAMQVTLWRDHTATAFPHYYAEGE